MEIEAKGYKFHRDHLRCKTCNKNLYGEMYAFRDDRFYCEEDFFKAFGKWCARCEQGIRGKFIFALNKNWCADHFTCEMCKKPFGDDDGHHAYDDKPYCDKCYPKISKDKKCSKCDKVIDFRQLVSSMGKDFHEACFVCGKGDHKIGRGAAFWVDSGKVWCKEHWESGDVIDHCAKCGKYIDSEYVKVAEKTFHSLCWKCKACKKPMKDNIATRSADGDFFCSNCRKIIPAGAKGAWVNGVWVPADAEEVKARRLVRGYGEYEVPPGCIPPWASPCYPLEVVRLPYGVIPKEIDFRQREQYLEEDVFRKEFGMEMADFNALPIWRRIMIKKDLKLF